jgi:hypothetical protein
MHDIFNGFRVASRAPNPSASDNARELDLTAHPRRLVVNRPRAGFSASLRRNFDLFGPR